jgi:predicted RNA methylase
MALNLSCQNRQHLHADRGLDLYETPPVATEALLRVESLPQRIWEPAAGRGAIVRALRAAGHEVVASDIRTYDFDLDFESDFLAATKAPAGIELLLTNPPYGRAGEFVTQALRLCPRVIMLCRLAFLESARRAPILDTGQLARIHVFKRRLPMMHRHGWTGPRASSAMAFGWFIWNRDHVGPTTVDRVSWGD